VIEVGVDVPSATVMVIEDADRFGLAQLHQLRGRVGRGSAPSYCALIATPKTKEAEERLRTIEHSGDGFAIAQADLTLRGPGEVLGTSQHGFGDLLVNQWQTDWQVVERIGRLADEVIAHRNLLAAGQWQWVLDSARERFVSSELS
ncbi:MAG: helicase-related protein, partial [Bacillota bacterium]